MNGPVAQLLRTSYECDIPLLFVLIDPDKAASESVQDFITEADTAGIDGFLIGGSLSLGTQFASCVQEAKRSTNKPVILFPGGVHQVCADADAILFLSLISGRNADQLIGQHVIAAPIVKAYGLEPIATGYMIVDSGEVTGTEYMSYSKPLPRHRPEIAVAHALAAEMLGMHCVYIEAGSGAKLTVPDEMITAVRRAVNIPLIVGGGIRNPGTAAEKVRAGASVIVVGNHFEDAGNHTQLRAFVDAVRTARQASITEV